MKGKKAVGSRAGAARSQKVWSGRFSEAPSPELEAFTESVSVDKRLFRHDIMGSIAHCRMLARQGILTAREAGRIERALREIERELGLGRLPLAARHEDIHMNIEHLLAEKVGPVAGKLHTARSRNDQVALDMRLFLREELAAIRQALTALMETILERAAGSVDTVLPGYTHLQRAQPVRLAHHLLAYFEMFLRDRQRLDQLAERVAVMPLGAGALAGTGFPIDPRSVASELGFARVFSNSMDAVSDRDFAIETCFVASVLMMHLSRWAEELVLWSSHEFGFVELADAYCTGSSMMPQKKNPDVLELIRGKTARVYGDLMALLALMKALPLTYNRDMQEDKEPLFHAVDTARESVIIFGKVLQTARFREERMRAAVEEGFLDATDAADYLARKGMPFRDAHRAVGKAVALCQKKGIRLQDLSSDEWKKVAGRLGPEVRAMLAASSPADRRSSPGGTSRESVLSQIERARALLDG